MYKGVRIFYGLLYIFKGARTMKTLHLTSIKIIEDEYRTQHIEDYVEG